MKRRSKASDRLTEATRDLRELRKLDPAGFAILCSVIERVRKGIKHKESN